MAVTKPGDQLRRIRQRLALTTRNVEEASRKIATAKANKDYAVSHGRLVQIESGESTPSVYKLYTLSAVYGLALAELLALYVNSAAATRYHLDLASLDTHLISAEAPDAHTTIDFPTRLEPGLDLTKTNLVSQMVEVWSQVPAALLQRMARRKVGWGYIGLSDYTMYPLLLPGSLVQIDEDLRASPSESGRSEFDRPIYFVELRDGYICSWCEFQSSRLLCISHPSSPVATREFAYPQQAKIIGRASAIARRLVDDAPPFVATGLKPPSSGMVG